VLRNADENGGDEEAEKSSIKEGFEGDLASNAYISYSNIENEHNKSS
jgi:hypothetical protein